MKQISHTGNLLQRHLFLSTWLVILVIVAAWSDRSSDWVGMFLVGLAYGTVMETRLSNVFLDGENLVVEHGGEMHRVDSRLIRGKLWKSLVFYGCYVIRLRENTGVGSSILLMPRKQGLFVTHGDFRQFRESTNTVGTP